MTLLLNLFFAQPCWQLSCLSGWEEQVFAELEPGTIALRPKLNPFAGCFPDPLAALAGHFSCGSAFAQKSGCQPSLVRAYAAPW